MDRAPEAGSGRAGRTFPCGHRADGAPCPPGAHSAGNCRWLASSAARTTISIHPRNDYRVAAEHPECGYPQFLAGPGPSGRGGCCTAGSCRHGDAQRGTPCTFPAAAPTCRILGRYQYIAGEPRKIAFKLELFSLLPQRAEVEIVLEEYVGASVNPSEVRQYIEQLRWSRLARDYVSSCLAEEVSASQRSST